MIPVREIADERGLDEEDVYELLEIFVDYTRTEDLAALQEAVDNGNAVVARQKAHSIKGAALNLKLTEISSLARTLESRCDALEDNPDSIQRVIVAIARALDEVSGFLQRRE